MLRWANNTMDAEATSYGTLPSRRSSALDQLGNPITVTVYNADGGKVIKTYRYDGRTDKETLHLYIIHNNDNLGDELSMILTKEAMYQ